MGCRLLSLSQFLSERKFQEVAFYNFIYLFGCAGSSLLCGLFSSCGSRAPYCSGLSCCGAWALGRVGSVAAAPGLESTGSVVVACAYCSVHVGSSWTRHQTMSPALAGGFFTAELPGKPQSCI